MFDDELSRICNRYGYQLDCLKNCYHGNDDFHYGETIYEHIKEVWIKCDTPLLKMIALYHDLGKPFCRKVIDGKVTFRNHAEISLDMFDALEDDPIARTIIKYHCHLQNPSKRFMHHPLYEYKDLFFKFAIADSVTEKALEETMKGIEIIEKQILRNFKAEEERKLKKIRQEEKFRSSINEITCIIGEEVGFDIKEIFRKLGQAKQYQKIDQIKKIIGE